MNIMELDSLNTMLGNSVQDVQEENPFLDTSWTHLKH